MNEQYENKLEELERVEAAQHEARGITKEAKYLCYPITDITVELSSLADKHDLEKEMEEQKMVSFKSSYFPHGNMLPKGERPTLLGRYRYHPG